MRPSVIPGAPGHEQANDEFHLIRDGEDLDEADAKQQKSAFSPANVQRPVSGGYMNQLPSGDRPMKMVQKNATPPKA